MSENEIYFMISFLVFGVGFLVGFFVALQVCSAAREAFGSLMKLREALDEIEKFLEELRDEEFVKEGEV